MRSCVPDQLTNPAPEAPRDNLDTGIPAGADSTTGGEGDAASHDRPTSSVFARAEGAPIHKVPMRVIHRPLPSELDEAKVQAFIDEMKVRGSTSVADSTTTHTPHTRLVPRLSSRTRVLTQGRGRVHANRGNQGPRAPQERPHANAAELLFCNGGLSPVRTLRVPQRLAGLGHTADGRYEATKRLGLETIRAKIIEVPASNMRIYMGAGCPF